MNYHFFYGGIYSQWYPSNFDFYGIQYNCAEQFMMAGKALVFNDELTYDKIMEADNPARQKRLGRLVSHFNSTIWMQVAFDIVTVGNILKFKQNQDLLQQLKLDCNGGTVEFVEASPYDTIWGVGLSENDPDILDKSNWNGTNLLGKAINRAHDFLTNENESDFDEIFSNAIGVFT
jgi:ribA/ribD-fused uncharacterized protein